MVDYSVAQPLLASALAFASSAAATSGRAAVDYVVSRRGITRKHGVAYLVKLAERFEP